MGHSDIESSSVTLQSGEKEPEENNAVIMLILF